MIEYSTQFIPTEDLKFLNKILKKKFLTQGPLTEKFEKEVGKLCDAKYSISVNSASSGLHLACMVIGLKNGDIVWTTANTFAATANAPLHCGCKVDFVDIDIATYNISLKALIKKLELAKKNKKLPKAIIVVHFAGNPCEMIEIYKLSKIYKFKIIEDASHALGAKYKLSKIGDCKYSDLVVFSFHPVKIITTAEGGMIMTKNKSYYNELKMLRTNGITRDIPKKQSWYYEQKMIGFNYRINEIQAALGISQLLNLKKWIKKRNLIGKIYNKNLKDLPIELPHVKKGNTSSFHLFVVLLKNSKFRDQLFQYLKKKKINCNFHYIPLYRHPFYKNKKINFKEFHNTEYYYARALSIPMHVQLDEKKINFISKNIKSFFNEKK